MRLSGYFISPYLAIPGLEFKCFRKLIISKTVFFLLQLLKKHNSNKKKQILQEKPLAFKKLVCFSTAFKSSYASLGPHAQDAICLWVDHFCFLRKPLAPEYGMHTSNPISCSSMKNREGVLVSFLYVVQFITSRNE